MTWSRALALWIVAALLAVVYRATEPAPLPVTSASSVPATARPSPGEAERAYDLDAATLQRIEVRRGDRAVVLERDGASWRVASPTDRTIPGGLVQAFVGQLVDGGHGDRIADDPADAAFGFAAPSFRIDATESSGERFGLVVGARTPTGTAAYGLIEQDGVVVLVGLNLLYYADLLLG